jgi:TonB-linked SusC/RagA family outer membrane protein
MEVSGKTVREVFKTIESQSLFRFFFNSEFTALDKKVSIKTFDATIDDVLSAVLSDTDMSYKVMDNNFIVITPGINLQQQQITGKITDATTGEALPGVTVLVKGTTVGGLSGVDGGYSVNVPAGATTLVISFIGYKTQEVEIGENKIVNVALVEEVTALEEVVVIGYGVQKKSLVTGAISSVSAEQIANTSVSRAEQALQGRTAGVQVISTSGAPGAEMKVRIRGYSSNGKADPLYIVDGVKTANISYLNPQDISNIEVLKDAASSAIYGAEGGNGVIIVTTKGGKAGTTEISYDYQYSGQSVGKLPEMLNALEYATYFNEAGLFTIDPSTIVHDTDWQDAIFTNGYSSRHNLSFSSGNEKSNFLLSLSSLGQDGIVVLDKDKYKRYTFRMNADSKLKDWLKIGSNANFAYTQRQSIIEDNESAGIITAGLLMDPLTPVTYAADETLPSHVTTPIAAGKILLKDENGLYYGISPFISKNPSNPFARLVTNKTSLKSYSLMGNLFTEIQPIKNVSFTSRLGYEISNTLSMGWNPVYFYNTYQAFNDVSSIVTATTNTNYWQWENFASYSNKVGLHNINILAGMSAESMMVQSINASGGPMLAENDDFAQLSLIASQANSGVGGMKTLDKKASYFGRISYDFNNKYMFQGTLRRDGAGTSMLPPANRWGLFPSFSTGWVFTEENFFPGSFIGYGKLRASWGKNGSLSNLSNYMYNSAVYLQYLLYELGDNVLYSASSRNQLDNPDLRWETSVQSDIGLDIRMFKDRLAINIDYFNKKTTDLITPNTPPLEAGNTAAMINGGDILNSGIEFMAEFQNNYGEFEYSISGNFSTLKNEVTFLNSSIQRILGGQSSGAATFFTAFEKGFPVWYFRGYKTDGIDMTTGQPNFIDQNGDGLINENDRVFIGSSIPDLTYGGTINLSFEGIDFTANIQGQVGNENMILWMRNDLPGANVPKFLYDGRWTPGSTDATRPKAGFNPNTLLSDQMLFKGNYMRVKQLQLGYKLPGTVLQAVQLKSARVYVSLEDYFTFTKYPGMDPEAGSTTNSQLGLDKGMYPITKKAIFGISITL